MERIMNLDGGMKGYVLTEDEYKAAQLETENLRKQVNKLRFLNNDLSGRLADILTENRNLKCLQKEVQNLRDYNQHLIESKNDLEHDNEELHEKIASIFEEGCEYAWELAQELLGMDEDRLWEIFEADLGEDVILNWNVDDAAKALAEFKAIETKKEEEMAKDAAIHDAEEEFADSVYQVVEKYMEKIQKLGGTVKEIAVHFPNDDSGITVQRVTQKPEDK